MAETREVAVIPVPKDSEVFRRWPGVKTIGSIYHCREIQGKREESQEFFISSLSCRVRALSKHLRLHWSIENSQHHVLDDDSDSDRVFKILAGCSMPLARR